MIFINGSEKRTWGGNKCQIPADTMKLDPWTGEEEKDTAEVGNFHKGVESLELKANPPNCSSSNMLVMEMLNINSSLEQDC